MPVRIGWTGSDPRGIDHYVVAVSIDGGTYKTLASDLHANSLLTHISSGHDYRYRVRGVDTKGNGSSWNYSAIQRQRTFQDTSASVHYAGTRHTRSLTSVLGGTVHYSFSTGATAQLTFSGRAVSWISRESLDSGHAVILIDGHYVKTISLNGPVVSRVIEFGRTWTSTGTHTIKIKVQGTAGHPRVYHDAFLVLY